MCENASKCEKKEPAVIPYVVHEAEMDRIERHSKAEIERAERHTKRWFIAAMIIFIAFVMSNVAWLIYESQYETISYSQDGDGLNNVNVGTQGDIWNEPNSQV